MKIRIGAKTFTGPGAESLLEQEIMANLNERFATGTTRLTRPAFAKIAERVTAAAEMETARMFPTAVSIIERSQAGMFRMREGQEFMNNAWDPMRERNAFTDAHLGGPTRVLGRTAIAKTGGINWVDLTPRWVRYKRAKGSKGVRKFFWYRGQLKGQLQNGINVQAWVAKMGGVKVRMTSEANRLRPYRRRMIERRWVVGSIDIEIFPNLTPALLPMLASRRWTDTTDGTFERFMFNGKMRDKLVGPPMKHRPLMQPITQFWLAFRIPTAIRRAIEVEMRRGK